MSGVEIERVALAIFKSNMHPSDAANEALVSRCRREWPQDWRRAERAAEAAIGELRSTPSEGRLSSIGAREAQAEPERPEHKLREQLISILKPISYSLPDFREGNVNNGADQILALFAPALTDPETKEGAR